MTRSETTKILAILTAAFPGAYRNLNEEEANGVVSVWNLHFANFPADIVFMALNKAISTSKKYPPTICEVKEKISSLYYEAYDALNGGFPLTEELNREYQRIYDITKDYKVSKTEIELSDILINSSRQYLLE